MGLLEKVNRQIEKLGLAPKLIRALPTFSIICALISVIWMAVLPVQGQFRNTYISENALLPHQASTHFRETEWDIVRGYRHAVRDLRALDETDRNAELARLFQEMGLKTAVHEWETKYPFGKLHKRHRKGETGENLYAIMHAPRGSSNEAIAVVAPWFNQDGALNEGGVALLLGLAHYFRRWSVWQKNIIFVLPSNSHVALRHWVDAYHSSLQHTAGSIEGAVVIDFPGTNDYFDYLEIDYDGLNGQQPNLDLVNTAIKIANDEFLDCEIHGMGMDYSTYRKRLEVLLAHMQRQILAGASVGPGSEMFSGWRIDAITIRARGDKGPHDITTHGRVVESTVRSINNLLEHFHQSFFFYVMLGPKYFVSIGTYLPAAMLLSNSYVLMAAYYLLNGDYVVSDMVPAVGTMAMLWVLGLLIGFLCVLSVPDFVSFSLIHVFAVGQLAITRYAISSGARTALYACALTVFGLYLTVLSTLNFSLSFVIGLSGLPFAWAQPSAGYNNRNVTVLLLTCPLIYYYLCSHFLELPLNAIFVGLVAAAYEVGSWHWRIVHSLWLPMWLCTFMSITAEPEDIEVTREEYEKIKNEEIEGSIN